MRRLIPSIAFLAALSATAAAPPLDGLEARARLLALADARRYDATLLRKLAAHPDGAVRAETAAVIGHLADARTLDLLGRLAGDGAAEVRARAAQAFGTLALDLPGERDVEAESLKRLSRLVSDDSPKVRAAAAWGLGALGSEEGFARLVRRLDNEPDASVRAFMLAELWRSRDAGWVRSAERALGDADAGVRFAATWSLARSGRPEAAAGLRRAARDRDPLVRAVALDGARRGRAADFWDEAAAGLRDPDARVRIAALLALAGPVAARSSATLPPPLDGLLPGLVAERDPQRAHERVAAIRLAGAARACRPQLVAAVGGSDEWSAAEALSALAAQAAPEAEGLIDGWLASESAPRRAGAVAAAALLPDAWGRLTRALEDAAPAVRLAALEAGAESLPIEAFEARLGDTDPAVRAAAVDALRARKAVPPHARLLELLAREGDAALPDAAVTIVDALAAGPALTGEARVALRSLLEGRDAVVARAAWGALRAHGAPVGLPEVATGRDLAYYREVVEWAGTGRWMTLVTVRGTIQVRLDTRNAPLACYRLTELAEAKFFENLTFHRVVPDFVIQGGDPRGDGWGGPGFALRDELSLAPFAAGAVGLALAGPDTGGSQVFVALTPQPHLTGRYPHLGTVVNGADVAERVRRGDRLLAARVGEGDLPPYLPVWYGRLGPARLDGAIPGWHTERENYRPRAEWLDQLRSARLRYDVTVAMGTWCPDSREQLPRLEAVLAALGEASPFAPPLMLGADRTKEVDPASFPFGPVERVPTIVVSAGGTEVGRIVETPASGSIEEDLVRMLAPLEGWDVPPPAGEQ
jgi:cyclophilin family peptidyl-prolyl cis-trans isomerase/HEAT repeat protein